MLELQGRRAGGRRAAPIPDIRIGWPVLSVAAIGLFFVAGSLASLLRARSAEPRALLDASFLIGLLVLFALQLDFGIRAVHHPHGGPFNSIAVLVVVCFLIGISRSWELIGGPSTSLRRELAETIRARRAPEGSARDDSPR